MRRRRGGMLGTVARTAVVAGTAQAAAGRVHRNQQQRFAAEASPPEAAPPEDGMDLKLDQLRQLGTLRDQGVVTDAEFESQKAAILGS